MNILKYSDEHFKKITLVLLGEWPVGKSRNRRPTEETVVLIRGQDGGRFD